VSDDKKAHPVCCWKILISDRFTTRRIIVRSEVLTAVTMKNAVSLDVAPCRSCVNRRLGGTYHLHLQGREIRERGTSVSRWLQTEPPAEDTQLVRRSLIFYPEDGGDMFLRNDGSYNIYTTPHPRKRHSSRHINCTHVVIFNTNTVNIPTSQTFRSYCNF
jgi:hypothetical protein